MKQASILMGLRAVVGIAGLVALVLGGLLWGGYAYAWLELHMLAGVLVVLALWAAAGLAVWAGVRMAPVVTAVVLGLVVLVIGVYQTRLLVGEFHWLVRLLHLLLGVWAIGQTQVLIKRIGRASG
jgi:hypothetical protein